MPCNINAAHMINVRDKRNESILAKGQFHEIFDYPVGLHVTYNSANVGRCERQDQELNIIGNSMYVRFFSIHFLIH
jgi:hypothetical protein